MYQALLLWSDNLKMKKIKINWSFKSSFKSLITFSFCWKWKVVTPFSPLFIALSFYSSVPKKFGLVHIFFVRPKIYLHIVPVTNILCQTKRWFAFSKIGFCAGTKVFEEALNAVKFLSWLKKFGPAQNILVPVDVVGRVKKIPKLCGCNMWMAPNSFLYLYNFQTY